MLCHVSNDGALDFQGGDTDLIRVARARVIAAETRAATDLGYTMPHPSSAIGLGLRADAVDGSGQRGAHRALVAFWGKTQEHLLRMGGAATARFLEAAQARGDLRADALDDLKASANLRGDAVDFANGANGAIGNLTAWMAKVVEEPMPVLNYGKVAKVENTLHPGASRYQVVYLASSGEAKVFAGGDGDFPVSEGIATYDLEQHWFMSKATVTVIDEAQYDFLGFQLRARMGKACEKGHLILQNRLFWSGNGKLKLWGLKNYPKLTRYDTGLSLASCTAGQLLSALIDVLRSPVEDSAQVFTPNVLALGTTIMTKAKSLQIGTGGTSAVSVYAYLRENFPEVSIEEMNELDDFEASGVNAAFAYPRNSDAAPTFEAAPPYAVPLVQDGIGVRMYYLSRCGGAFMPHVVGARICLIAD